MSATPTTTAPAAAVLKTATEVQDFADWGTSGFKAITWRKVELVRDLVMQVRTVPDSPVRLQICSFK